VTVDLAEKFFDDFEKRVFSVMLTDSVHRLKRYPSLMLIFKTWASFNQNIEL